MIESLIQSLNAFDINAPATISAICSQLSATAEGNLLDEAAWNRFWSAIGDSHSTDILRRLIAIYIEVRHECLQQAKRDDFDFDFFDSATFQLNLNFLGLLPEAGIYVQDCLDDIVEMLLDGDNEIFSTASKMLAASPCNPFIPAKQLLEAFALHGVCEYPFSLGEATIKAACHNPSLATVLVAALNENKNVNKAVLTILARLPLPDASKLEAACYYAQCSDEDCACIAIGALGDIGVDSPLVATIVANALESEQWLMRASAAETAGKLKINPTQILPSLVRLLDDTEGHDFTVRECAIEGFGHYGALAKDYLDNLIGLKQLLLSDDDEIGDLKRLDEAISTISATE